MDGVKRRGVTGVELVTVAIVLAVVAGLVMTVVSKERAQQMRSDAGALVWDCLLRERPEAANGIGGYESALVENGVGIRIIGYRGAAFWVKGKMLYTVDEAARDLLPRHPQAPPRITNEAIRRALR